MKFSCQKDEIVSALTSVSYAVSTKSTIPVLEGVLLTVEDNTLKLLGYDQEMAISTSIPIQTQEEGSIVLTGKTFLDMLRKILSDTLEIESNEKLLTTITGGNTVFTLEGIHANDFPELPQLENLNEFTVSKEQLKSMLTQTLYAVSTATDRPAHMGAKFDLENGILRVAGVDGFRLAIRQENISSQETLSFIAPGKNLADIVKLIDNEEGDVTISLAQSFVSFSMENFYILTRLIKGDFIEYQKSIPKKVNEIIQINTREFINALDRASLLIASNIKSPLKIHFEKGQIRLLCSTPLGKLDDEIHIEGYQGEPQDAGFNCRYLLEAMRAAGTDEVKIYYNGPLAPMMIQPVDGDSFIFLILPVRLA